MMGSRGAGSGDDYDAFSRRARRIVRWKRGETHAIKQRHSRWQRRLHKWRARLEAGVSARHV